MAKVILKSEDMLIEKEVNKRGMVDEYNLAVAIVLAIKAFSAQEL